MTRKVQTSPAAGAKKKRLTPDQHIICQAKSLGVVGKHAGSKPISRLKKSIARVNDDYQKQRFAAKMAAKEAAEKAAAEEAAKAAEQAAAEKAAKQKAQKAKTTKKYKPQKKV
ncbi:MAG: hypothetical protein J5957_10070 [Prevotella sp.]|nr:hypothetical protein [Prevotella sp.]